MRINRIAFIPAAILIAGTALPALAQQTAVYPSRGQSAQQQSADESACYTWAKQQTGIDPAKVANGAPQAQAQNGQRVRGAAGGAAVGAAAGAIAGNAGRGAAIGAVSGEVAGGIAHRRQERAAEAQNAQTESAQQQALASFHRAWGACMQGRGYSLR